MSRDRKKAPAEEPTAELLPVPKPGRYGDGKRRGFLRRRRAMLPLTLVGSSLLVVLIVVLLSVVFPAAGPGRIPLGAAPVNTQDSGSATPSGPGGPSGSPSASASVPASASASGSAKPSASTRSSAPAGGVVAAAPGGNGGVATGAPTPTPPAPVTLEAESATLSGTAAKATCGTCSGGQKVRFVGGASANYVTFGAVQAPAAGSYRLVITYELDTTSRTFDVSANGGAATAVTVTGSTADFSTPNAVTLTITLKAGANSIKIYNNTADAPDLDKITVGG